MLMPLALACQPAAGHDSQVKIRAPLRVENEAREQARREVGSIRVVVDRSDRKVRVYRGDEVISIEAVAVGMAKYPTLTGSWKFYRVDLNPEWNPPKRNWAKGRKRAPPGRAENPMGRARLVFNMPYTIHGTDDLGSLGKAASHGSVRISNEVVMDLAEVLLRAGGSWGGDRWFEIEKEIKRSGKKEAIMLVGRDLQRLSNGRYPAGLHRVVSYGVQEPSFAGTESPSMVSPLELISSGNNCHRLSIVFSLRAHGPTIINSDELETLVTGAWPQRTNGVTAADWFKDDCAKYYDINSPPEEREEARKKQQRDILRSDKLIEWNM